MLHVQSLLFGCSLCLVVTSVIADGRVFVLGPRSLSGFLAFRDAQQACASQRARLASVEELRHAVAECFFSQCTRGWLHGGTVGTTVCNTEGSSLKAVNVRTENGTEDTAHLSAFCLKDKAVACGDPPSFPNARLQESSGFEMGDELLYTCLPGYVMPTGRAAFSLMCDSCGEWYGTVQLCVKDKTESHVDYEDKFEDSYEAADHDRGIPEEQHDKTSEEVFGSQDRKISLQQTTRFRVNAGAEHHDQHEERDVREAVINNRRAFGGAVDEAAKREDQVHPRWGQERSEDVGTNAAEATEEPVSLLSQKHMFWFPSEAFQNEKAPLSPDSITQTKQRASGAQSQESKENESQERHDISHPTDDDDHDDEQDRYDELDNDEGDDRDDSRHNDHDDHDHDHDDHDHDHDDHDHDHDDHDNHDNHDDHDDHDNHDAHDDHNDHDDHEDDLTDIPDDPDSHQEEDDHVMHRGEHERTRDRHQDHDVHDVHDGTGTHEKDRDHVRYGTQEYDDQDDPYDEHHSREDHVDTTDDQDNNDDEHPDGSEEHPDHNDHDDDDDDDDDHLPDHDIHDDHEDKYDKSYDDHDSHEDADSHSRVIFSVATEERPIITQRGAGGKTTKDETWLDGYPIQGTENGDSTKRPVRPVDGEQAVKTTDTPNDVEVRKRIPHTNSPSKRESPTTAPERVVEKVRPGYRTPGTSPDDLQSLDSPSYSDTLDYDTQQVAPTQSWLDELTEHPFLDHGLAPPVHDGDIFPGMIGEHAVHNLPGEMGEAEGEMGEAICTGDDCPPHPPSSSSRGPTVAAIAVLVCVVAMAVIFGVWCYKRQQQKSSIYEMNGKGQNQSRPGQQIEMQQKV